MINPEIIVALDVPNKKLMEQTLDRMPNSIKWYKIGLELFCSEGPEILTSLKNFFRLKVTRYSKDCLKCY
jgi:orotidine-5'-phosphate decarboxylase